MTDLNRAEAQKISIRQYKDDLQNAWDRTQYDIGAQAQLGLFTSTTNVYTTVAADTMVRLQTLNFQVSSGTSFVDPITSRSMTPIIVYWS